MIVSALVDHPTRFVVDIALRWKHGPTQIASVGAPDRVQQGLLWAWELQELREPEQQGLLRDREHHSLGKRKHNG